MAARRSSEEAASAIFGNALTSCFSAIYAHQIKPAYARRGEKQGRTPSETGACSNGGYGRGQLSFPENRLQ